jgi:hypothetical protein
MRKVVRRRIRRQSDGINLVADVNLTVVTGSSAGEETSGRQEVRIVQKGWSRAGKPEDRR